MKFTHHLAAHVTPEWHKQYVKYEYLKELIYKARAQAPSPDEVSLEDTMAYLRRFDSEFFRICDQELAKINSFFLEKLAEANRRHVGLKTDLSELDQQETRREEPVSAHKHISSKQQPATGDEEQDADAPELPEDKLRTETAPTRFRQRQARRRADLKLAFSEFYLSLVLIQNYQRLNFEGFRKILKKHDKILTILLNAARSPEGNLSTGGAEAITTGGNWHAKNVENAPFAMNHDVDVLIQQIEGLVTDKLEGGDRKRALKRLRVPPLSERMSNKTSFLLGLWSGGVFVLLAIAAILLVLVPRPSGSLIAPLALDGSYSWVPAIRLFRGPFLLILFIAGCGFNTWGWRRGGVNHVLIFEIDPRNHLMFMDMLEMAAFLGLFWAAALVFYAAAPLALDDEIVATLVPSLLILIYFVDPINIWYKSARCWLLKQLARVLTPGFRKVTFAEFWIADQLNSLVMILLDAAFAFCYFGCEVPLVLTALFEPASNATLTSSSDTDTARIGSSSANASGSGRPFNAVSLCNSHLFFSVMAISVAPPLIRLIQCLRRYYDSKLHWHLLNVGKYLAACLVAIVAGLEAFFGGVWLLHLWAVSSFVSSVYGYYWDVKMDWGLFDHHMWYKKSVKQRSPTHDESVKPVGEGSKRFNRFLREEIVYRKSYYYLAAAVDLLLRFAWIATFALRLVPMPLTNTHRELARTVLATLEVIRRIMWNFFRLENEHLNNCGQYRAVRDISVAPLTEQDVRELTDLMDAEDDSVLQRYRATRRKMVLKTRQQLLKVKERALEKAHAAAAESGVDGRLPQTGGLVRRLWQRRRRAPAAGQVEDTIELQELPPDVEKELLLELGIDEETLREYAPRRPPATGIEGAPYDTWNAADAEHVAAVESRSRLKMVA